MVGLEDTQLGRTYMKRMTNLKANGYHVKLFFLWLPSADIVVTRVANRVSQGGHDVPLEDIRRRFSAGLRKAARKVVRRGIETNTPIIVYQDGADVNLDPHTMLPWQ